MDMRFEEEAGFYGPPDSREFPRFMGPATFARLPRIDQVSRFDVALVGVPFDIGTSYRPGARFGPIGIRQGSRTLRNWHPDLQVRPFGSQQVVDAGDIACNTFDIADAMAAIEAGAAELTADGARLLALGGDHTVAFPLLQATHRVHGPVALVHFDSHVDTYDTYMGARFMHGAPFRRAGEEGLFEPRPLDTCGHPGLQVRSRRPRRRCRLRLRRHGDVGDRPNRRRWLRRTDSRAGRRSADLRVDRHRCARPRLRTSHRDPRSRGFSSRELLGILRGLRGIHIVGADIVEVAPAYDHADITSIAAANVAYELLSLMAPTDA